MGMVFLLAGAGNVNAQHKKGAGNLGLKIDGSFESVESVLTNDFDRPFAIKGQLMKNVSLQQGADAQVLAKVATVFGVDDPKNNFRTLKVSTDALQMTHAKVAQTYKGIDVFGGELILHTDRNGTLTEVNGRAIPNLNVNATASISADRALQLALAEIGNVPYRWLDADAEQILKEVYEDESRSWKPTPKLSIAPVNGDFDVADYRLTWHFVIPVDGDEPANWHYFVDAATGEVINKYNAIHHADKAGSGTSTYYGNVSFRVNSTSKTNQMYDVVRKIKTYDGKNRTTLPGTLSTDADAVWSTTAQKAMVDAHWGASKVYDYYSSTHARNSFNGAGAEIRSTVHHRSGYNNAFWNGSQMVYGDGDGVNFTALTSLDVVAHELTHAVTEYESSLVYQGESGALNEAMSDIFGAAVEFAVFSDANWLIGEDCYTPGTSGDALRYMNNPNLGDQPDTYQGTMWASTSSTYDNGGVHINSGVLNFAFYLMSAGGSGTNDAGTAFSVAAIGIDKARLIAYRANANYMTSSSNFAAARSAFLSAATDLYGASSAEYTSVDNAFKAVGVGGTSGGGGGTTPPTNYVEAESNNSISTANGIPTVPASIKGKVGTTTDSDYFSISVSAGKVLSLGLTVPSTKDYDLYLYNSAGTILAKSEAGTGAAESINYTASTTATYYIRVLGYNKAYSTTLDYTLSVSKPNGLTGEEIAVEDNRSFRLLGNFPNPFNPGTEIRFEMPARQHATLQVYDMTGRVVATLLNGILPQGEQTVSFNASGLSSGVYIYRLQSGAKVLSGRMTLLK